MLLCLKILFHSKWPVHGTSDMTICYLSCFLWIIRNSPHPWRFMQSSACHGLFVYSICQPICPQYLCVISKYIHAFLASFWSLSTHTNWYVWRFDQPVDHANSRWQLQITRMLNHQLLEPRKKLQSHQSSSWPRWGDHSRDSHDGQFNDLLKYTQIAVSVVLYGFVQNMWWIGYVWFVFL